MKYYEIELNDKTIKFRLKSEDMLKIEEITKKPILDLIKDYSLTNVIMFLQYMRRSDDKNFSRTNASDLYDELVDNGYTLQDVVFKIIYKTLVYSGVLSEGEYQKVMDSQKETETTD